MSIKALIRKLLPRRALRRARRYRYRCLGWWRWSRAIVRALLREDHVQLPAGSLACITAENRYGVYCVPRSARAKSEAQVLLKSGVWEPQTLDLLRGVDPSADILIAGTFFGDFLPALSRSRSDGALVWGFEPNSESYRCAQITLLLNDLENVVLTHAGLGAQAGETALLATHDTVGVPQGGRSHVVKEASRAGRWATEEITLVTVDETVGAERRVAAIQLDVEEHETEALEGALQTIERCRPLLVVESLPTQEWLEANLTPLGYALDGWVHSNAVLRCR